MQPKVICMLCGHKHMNTNAKLKMAMYTCNICKKNFSERKNLKSHQDNVHPHLTHQENEKLPKEESESRVNIEDYLEDGDAELMRLIRMDWKSIRTNYHRGKITNTYNFRLQGDKKEIDDLLWKVFFDQKSPFRKIDQ